MEGSVRSISLVFPAYNEEANIQTVITEAIWTLKNLGITAYDIIVVNDGSVDQTASEVKKLSKLNPQIHLVENSQNLGYGATVRHGFSQALVFENEWVFFTDSDGQFRLADLTKLINSQTAENTDMVIGYRIKRADPFHRRMFAKGWTNFSRILLGFEAKDIDCAFKLIHRRVLENINLTGDGAAMNPELLAKAIAMGFTFTQVGVNHYPRTAGTQSGSNIKVIVRSFRSLFSIFLELRKLESNLEVVVEKKET